MNGNHKTDDLQELENHWERRNNSSNVSGILNQDLHNFSNNEAMASCIMPSQQKPRKPVLVSNHCYKSKHKRPLAIISDKCYCTKTPVKSKFVGKLREAEFEVPITPKCKQPNQAYRECDCGICKRRDVNSPPRLTCNCLPTMGDSPHSTRCSCKCACCLIQSLRRCPTSYLPCIHSETSRNSNEKYKTVEELEQAYSETFNETENNKELDSILGDDKSIFNGAASSAKSLRSDSNNRVATTQKSGAQISFNRNKKKASENNQLTFFKSTTDARANLEKLCTFRKENYFDCYAVQVDPGLLEEDHKCVHKFVLNERLIPQPLNADVFGTSRCVLCSKPMHSEILSNALMKRRLKSKSADLSYLDKIPTQVNISSRKNRIEIKIPFSLEKISDLFASNGSIVLKKPVPRNSIALRYQKGVA